MIREFVPDDIIFIEEVGKILDPNYMFRINPYIKCLVYEMDKKIIGFVSYFILYNSCEIMDIAVKEEYQRKKIGTNLLNAVIKDCQNNKCESITLEVRTSNSKAISFYRVHGFREASVRKSYYNDGEDALLMIKML